MSRVPACIFAVSVTKINLSSFYRVSPSWTNSPRPALFVWVPLNLIKLTGLTTHPYILESRRLEGKHLGLHQIRPVVSREKVGHRNFLAMQELDAERGGVSHLSFTVTAIWEKQSVGGRVYFGSQPTDSTLL